MVNSPNVNEVTEEKENDKENRAQAESGEKTDFFGASSAKRVPEAEQGEKRAELGEVRKVQT